MKVRNVNLGRNYELEDDLFDGLKSAVDTTRPVLALEYVRAILLDFEERLSDLEDKSDSEEAVAKEEPKPKTQKVAAKSDAKSDSTL